MALTRNYDKFTLLEKNREINPNQLDKIKVSISENGYLQSCPIIVDGDFRIIDGQHRYMACKELGLPVYYTQEPDAKDNMIITLNTTQRSWNLSDYINYYAVEGYAAYMSLKRFMNECKLGSTIAMALLDIPINRGGDTTRKVRNGALQLDHATLSRGRRRFEKISEILETCKLPVQTRIIGALISLEKSNSNFSYATMLSKVSRQVDRIRRCSTQDGYERMFCELYNNRNSNPIRMNGIYHNV